MKVAHGGHPLAVHVGSTGPCPLGVPGTLLGTLDEIDISPVDVTLRPGDVVVFHTDGATDLPLPHDIDETAWIELVDTAVASGGTAEEIAHTIHEALEAVLPFESRHDDIALLVLRVT
jgi:sigma-B regulation protein RsbU (phosphoserine phosphatase)